MSVVLRGLVFTFVFLLALAGCSNNDDVTDMPGQGTEVRMARANWPTGWFQAEVYANLLRRLGYEVNDPADLEFVPVDFYEGAARGEIDLWVNGWFPADERWLEQTIDGLGQIGDFVEPVGVQVEQGGQAGFLTDRATADSAGISSLGELVRDPTLIDLLDFDDNGRAEILGCPEAWVCSGDIDEVIAEIGPEVLEQVTGDYDALVQLAQRRIQARQPVLIYAWTPTATVEILPLGDAVAWLDTSPAGSPNSVVTMERSDCTRVQCRMGFDVNDIRVAANSEFLAENPAAAVLFEVVEIPIGDIQAQNLAMTRGEDSPSDLAAQAQAWLDSRKGEVLDWLRAARRAAADS